jgi:predicted MPP superfamily phosphohydrolase
VALGYGTFIERQNFQVQEVTIPVAGLPKALNGLRIVQITDIHMGAFLSERDGERIVAMANETKAHLAIMTGDLVTRTGDPVDVCLRQLARVKADAGMIGCLGNHEIYAEVEDYVTAKGKRLGIEFLRSESKLMEFRGEKLNFAGVDYQRKGEKYLVGAERLIEPGVTNILLSHNPDVFPVAVRQGYALTLAGHTHGGQITVEYLQQFVNPARFATRYVSGLYTEADSRIYVSRGLGTVGVPTRICAPPELTVISLAAV